MIFILYVLFVEVLIATRTTGVRNVLDVSDVLMANCVNPFSSGPFFGQVQKFFFLENLLLARF